jgi:hypothetical protein
MIKIIPLASENGNFRARSTTDYYHHYNYNFSQICYHTNYKNSVLNYSCVAPKSEVRTAVMLVLLLLA